MRVSGRDSLCGEQPATEVEELVSYGGKHVRPVSLIQKIHCKDFGCLLYLVSYFYSHFPLFQLYSTKE